MRACVRACVRATMKRLWWCAVDGVGVIMCEDIGVTVWGGDGVMVYG